MSTYGLFYIPSRAQPSLKNIGYLRKEFTDEIKFYSIDDFLSREKLLPMDGTIVPYSFVQRLSVKKNDLLQMRDGDLLYEFTETYGQHICVYLVVREIMQTLQDMCSKSVSHNGIECTKHLRSLIGRFAVQSAIVINTIQSPTDDEEEVYYEPGLADYMANNLYPECPYVDRCRVEEFRRLYPTYESRYVSPKVAIDEIEMHM